MEKSELKRRSIISVISLFFQSGYTAVLGLIANLVLTVLLTPTIFGIYITVLSLISFLNYFSDIGLAASLIQKKETTDEDLRTTFTVQQILVITLVILGFLATPLVQGFYKYKLPPEGIYLYWALLASFFISSLKTIPSVLLERKIQFQKIVLVQIIENTIFYTTVTIAALLGFGLHSFTIAVLVRSIVGLVTIYTISFWRPRIGISLVNLRELATFGLPFQASSFLALFKDDLIILYLGKIVGFEGVGYIGWAKKWAESPIRIIMDNVTRILFPVIARSQTDKDRVRRIIERVLHYQSILIPPALAGLVLIMDTLVHVIPRYSKWAPALPLFYIFIVSALFSSYSTPLINLFNALGKVKTSLFFMALWTVSIWFLTPTLTHLYGIYGFPLAQLILASTFILVVLQAQKLLHFAFIGPIYKPLLATLAMFFIVTLIKIFLLPSFFSIIVIAVSGALSYLCILYLLKVNLIHELRSFFKND